MYIHQIESSENDKKMVTNPDEGKHDIASALIINQKKSKKHISIWMIIKQLPQVNTVFYSICVFSLLLALYGNIRQTNVEEKLKLLIQLQDRVLVLESTLHTTVNSKYFPNDVRPHAIDFNYDTKLSGNRFLTIEKTHRQRRETKSLEQRHTQVTPSPMCLCPSGPPGPPGKRGKRGKKGDSGNLGPVGQPGQKGQKGDLGYPAMDVFQTVKGEPGEPGPPGPTGPPGITGIPGRDGERGPPGQPGVPGKGLQGISGPIGPQGVVGAPGSKGEKGDKGERGLTTTIKGDEFPTGIIEGPPGPPGPPGLQGPHGEKGDVGPQGPPGPQGEKGPRGKRGKRIFGSGKDEDYEDAAVTVLRGPPGPPGISGRDGKDGKDGSKGERGEPGEPGSLGPRGLDGIPGETGLVGPPGMPGYEGPAGQKGDRGDIGPPGLMGPPGLPGPPGYPGSKGEKGDKGDSKYRKMRRRENDELSNAPQISLVDYVCGPPGPPGPMGAPGRPGLQGEHGSNGPKGDRGEKGDKGEKGPMGLPGQLAIRSDARSVSYNGKTDHSMTYMAKQKGTGRVKWRLGTTSSSIIGGERDRRHPRNKDIQNVYVNQSEYAGKYQRYLKRMRKCGQEGSYKHFDNGTQAHCSDHVRELYTFLHISNRKLTSINRLESRYKREQENSDLYYVHLCFDVKNLPDNIEEATLRLSVRTHGLEADILLHNNISYIFTPYQLNVTHQLSSVRTRNEMAQDNSKYDSKAVRGLIFNKENKKSNSKGTTLISCFDQKTKDKIISEEKYVLNLKMFHVIEPYGKIWLDSRAIELNRSQLCSKSNVWVEFDVMKVVESKPFKSLKKLDFEIQCEHCTNLGVQISGDISSHFGRLQEPALYAIVSSGGRRAKRSRKYQHFIENGHRKPRKTDCYEGNKKCCRHGMQVVFKEMKGFEFIIQPKLFDAGYCSGKCPPRYNPAHHHALLQSLIRRYDQKRVPRLCCVPSKLTELEVLHVDERDSTKLKVSTWRDMKLLECACS